MTTIRLLVPVILAALLLLSGCAKQQPSPTIPDATISIIETTAPEADVTGDWVLDFETTETNLQVSQTLQGLFGTGLQEGSGMSIRADGSFDYYIGISEGGEGTYVRSGQELLVQVTPYAEVAAVPRTSLSLTILTEGDTTWLVMEMYGENLYWKRS